MDFDILAQCTKYQNGFTETSQTVKVGLITALQSIFERFFCMIHNYKLMDFVQDFWTVAKAMSTEEKKMLLQFITGSDRVPVGGLAKLEIIIARNGDSKERFVLMCLVMFFFYFLFL